MSETSTLREQLGAAFHHLLRETMNNPDISTGRKAEDVYDIGINITRLNLGNVVVPVSTPPLAQQS